VDANQGPDVYELKLLLGEELAPRWHWGFNGVYEQEVGGGARHGTLLHSRHQLHPAG
jgi:hypothetical protein